MLLGSDTKSESSGSETGAPTSSPKLLTAKEANRMQKQPLKGGRYLPVTPGERRTSEIRELLQLNSRSIQVTGARIRIEIPRRTCAWPAGRCVTRLSGTVIRDVPSEPPRHRPRSCQSGHHQEGARAGEEEEEPRARLRRNAGGSGHGGKQDGGSAGSPSWDCRVTQQFPPC